MNDLLDDRLEGELARLEDQINMLIALSQRLHEDNRGLRQQAETLQAERAALAQKHDLARARIEAMIERLRALESAG